jgi:hypothetical protein
MESSFLAPPFNNIHVSSFAWNEIKVIMGMLLFVLLCKKNCVVVDIWLTWNDNSLLQVGLSFGLDISIHNIAIISAILLLFM